MKSRIALATLSRAGVVGLWLGALTPLLSIAAATAPSPPQIVITPSAVEPAVLRVMIGERVDFTNRAQRSVHVQFSDAIRAHQVVQIPDTGPIWAVFYRPGTHPYVVHLYQEGVATTLRGLVEVVEDPQHPYPYFICGLVIMEECFEP